MHVLILLIAALLTAAISAIIGMGGGVTLLALMTLLLPAHQVVALHGVVQLASNFSRTVVFIKHVRFRIFWVYALPLGIGIGVASQLQSLVLPWFRPLIGGYILAFLLWRRYQPKLRNPPLWSYAPLGLVTGFAALLVGATGPLIAPMFLRDDFENEQVIATKAACQSLGHLLKIPAFLSIGFSYSEHLSLLVGMVAAVVVGTLLGKRILKQLSKRVFTALFETALLIAALVLIARAFIG